MAVGQQCLAAQRSGVTSASRYGRPWPTCRRRGRSSRPLAFGLVLKRALAAVPGGADGPGDLATGEACCFCCQDQLDQDGGLVGFYGVAGGPVKAGVAVAFLEAPDPRGQVAEVAGHRSRGPGRPGPPGVQQAGHSGAVQASGLRLVCDEPVGPAVDLGWRGQDVPAAGAEVQVLARQPSGCLIAAGEVGVQATAGRGDDRADGI
jgi:hypothetical protein